MPSVEEVIKIKRRDQKSGEPFVSIIINCYNGQRYLENAIKSVIAQTYTNWELLLWDNHSVDDSRKIFQKYKDERFVYCFANEFTSLGHARNLAVQKARGKWIGFLDCDDIWLPEKLQKQVQLINKTTKKIDMVYSQSSNLVEENANKSLWGRKKSNVRNSFKQKILPDGDIFNDLLHYNFVPLLTALFTKEIFNRVGGISTNLNFAEDYELFLKISSISLVGVIQKPLGLYRIHEKNLSIGNELKEFNESLEIISNYNYLRNFDEIKRFHNTTYGISLIRDKKIFDGLIHILRYGSMNSVLYRLRKFSMLKGVFGSLIP